MLRICGRQTHRTNINITDLETYFKIFDFLPFPDFIIQALRRHFNDKLSHVMTL